MDYSDAISSRYHTTKTHPHPNLPLEGEGVFHRATTCTDTFALKGKELKAQIPNIKAKKGEKVMAHPSFSPRSSAFRR